MTNKEKIEAICGVITLIIIMILSYFLGYIMRGNG